MKKFLVVSFIAIIVLGIVGVGAYVWYNRQINSPASDTNSLADIEIEQGESVKDIAVKLQTAGVIRSSDIFFLYVKLNKIAPEIQAGKFQIPQNLTVVEVAEIIQRAAGSDIWITIPEGLRMDEIAELLDEKFLKEENTQFDENVFLDIAQNPQGYDLGVDIIENIPDGKSLEGFLFPDTYNVRKDITTEELVILLVQTLEDKLENARLNIESHDSLSAYEIMILASIIEREAFTDEEKYMISDILQKRLRGEMEGIKLLQADATLLYEEKDWKAVVTKELKEKDSPYNTYKVTGLTPTPICNPGIEAIKATLDPSENEYFFYLHDEDGKIHYAKTHDEHVNNERCYINKSPDYCL